MLKARIVLKSTAYLFIVSVIYYFAFTLHNLLLYAIAFILLGSTTLILHVKDFYKYSTEFIDWYYRFSDFLKIFHKCLAIVFAVLPLIYYKDLLSIFIASTIISTIIFLETIHQLLITPSIAFSIGLTFLIAIWTIEPSLSGSGAYIFRVFSTLLALTLIIPSIMYVVRKYLEVRGHVVYPVTMPISVAILILGIALLISYPIMPQLLYLIVCLPWGSIFIVATVYSITAYLRGSSWSTAIYHGDLVVEAKDNLVEILERHGVEYDITTPRFTSGGYIFTITRPFRAKITLRRWVHRAIIRMHGHVKKFEAGEPGLVIMVKPGPKKAPELLRKIMIELLESIGISSIEWKEQSLS